MPDRNGHIAAAELHLAFLGELAIALPAGARILDFGRGAGEAVALLCERGFDCHGVDINPHWARDWADRHAFAARLALLDPGNYRLPFPERHFDFCFSDQVLEHVGDYRTVFRELGRVLKPGAISLHRFPGPNYLFEGHVALPLPLLCRCRPYLAAGAALGRRAPGQAGLSWRQTLADNRRRMAETFYPSKRRLKRFAAAAGVRIDFLERRELATCPSGRLAALLRRCEALGAGRLAQLLLPLIAQRYMLLRPRVAAAGGDPVTPAAGSRRF